MAQDVQEVRIFIASPSDVVHYRKITSELIEEINGILHAQGSRIRGKAVGWETLSPGVGEDGQDVINRQVGDNFDIFVGILWHRFGTPTNRAESGTEEEFNRALELHRRSPNRIKVLTYKCNVGPDDLESVDPVQLGKLNDFVKHLRAAGVFYQPFSTEEQFIKNLRLHLLTDLAAFGTKWGGKPTERHRSLTGRLLELHDEIDGPFRSSPVLRSLREKLEAAGIECKERLLNCSRQQLEEVDIDAATIDRIEEDLARYGRALRAHNTPVTPLDELALTPSSRNAIRQLGVTTPDELSSHSWNDLMRSGYFTPKWIEEISLRLQEHGLELRQTSEKRLTYAEALDRTK